MTVKRFIVCASAVVLLVCAIGCSSGSSTPAAPGTGDGGTTPTPRSERAMLDDAFRIDILSIDVTYDLDPAAGTITGDAEVRFVMREGQTMPVIHFDPALRGHTPTRMELDGEALAFNDGEDSHWVRFDGTTQWTLELLREVSGTTEHELHMQFPLSFASDGPFFYTDVNDIQGNGNEERFPTINTPHELARHRITFRVHGETPYRCIGSGSVTRTEATDVQVWVLDTGREVASYTVMFMLMPEADSVMAEQVIDGVPVRVMAFAGGSSPEGVFTQLESWLPELRENLGPFPMPSGLSVFLTESGGGMEYYGGTITSLRALNHEVFHMYYGTSTIARTYRDSWWDEAINMWYEGSATGTVTAIPDSYRSNMVSARTPISVGFDTRAYNEGARIIQSVAEVLGGRADMVAFLSDLHRRRSFDPFNTFDLADEIRDYSGVDMTERFLNWLYLGQRTYFTPAGGASSDHFWLHEVDMTPPPAIRERYRAR